MAIDVKRITRTGLFIIVFGVGGAFLWGATAPLNGAVVVIGMVKVEGSRKTVQHNEGGIVKSILVKDGDTVAPGQTLIRLEDASVSAQYGIVRSALDAELARLARLSAEATLGETPVFGTELAARAGEASVQELQDRELALFSSRRHALLEQQRLIREQMGEIREEVRALRQQRKAELEALALADQELDSYEALEGKAYVAEVRVLAQRRMVSEYQSRAEERSAEAARASQRITELELRIAAVGNEYASRAAEELKENSSRIQELRERLQSIRAPVAGRVLGLRVHTDRKSVV